MTLYKKRPSDEQLELRGLSLIDEQRALIEWAEIPSGSRVLDVATGRGRTAALLVEHGCKVITCDYDPMILAEVAESFGTDSDIEYMTADARKLPFADGEFDYVVSTNTLHEISPPDTVVRELARVCSPNGVLALCDFNKKGFDLFDEIHGELYGQKHGRGEFNSENTLTLLKSLFSDVCHKELQLNYCYKALRKQTN